MPLLRTFHWPKEISWTGLTSVLQGSIILPPGGISSGIITQFTIYVVAIRIYVVFRAHVPIKFDLLL